MPSDITITGALRNQVQSLLKGKSGNAAAPTNTGATPPAVLSETDTTNIVAKINEQTQSLEALLDNIGNSLNALNKVRTAIQEISGFLEEAGGITVQARNFFTNAETDKSKLPENLAILENHYKLVMKHINDIVDETATGNINLLKGEVLETKLGDDDHNSITTPGLDLTTQGLGLRAPNFASLKTIQDSRIDVLNALDMTTALRNTISSDIALLQTRQDFSGIAMNTLGFAKENMPKLNLSNEAAQLMALHLRQQLGASDASLASEAQQYLLSQFL